MHFLFSIKLSKTWAKNMRDTHVRYNINFSFIIPLAISLMIIVQLSGSCSYGKEKT